MQVERLDWDSDFFGFGVGVLKPQSTAAVPALVKEARASGLKLLYWFADPQDGEAAAAAEAVGAFLADRKVTFLADASSRSGEVAPGLHTATKVTPQLHSLALQSGHYSRFKVDPRMPPDAFERMYTLFIERSVSGALAREVIVADDEAGFITLREKGDRLDIGFLAVDSKVRSRGLGAQLVSAAFARAQQWGFAKVQVVTQTDNEGACRFYERCGFGRERVEFVYHVWV